MITANVTGSVYAGTPLILTCDYSLSPSVDTDLQTLVTWTVNDTTVDTSENGHIFSDGVSLIFSPLTTSDTGRYTCKVMIEDEEKRGDEKYITVNSK